MIVGSVLGSVIGLAIVVADQPSRTNVLLVFQPKWFVVLASAWYASFWLCYALISSKPWHMKLGRLTLMTLSGLSMIAILELLAVLRVVDYSRALGTLSGLKTWQDSRWWRPDRELIYARRPGQQIRGRTSGDACYRIGAPSVRSYWMDVQYDENGFRNPRTYERADVVVIGDSFVEAGLVAAEHTLVQRLAQQLEFTVVNLGVSAYGPQQELIVHRRYAMPLKPAYVVWLFFEGNDLSDVHEFELTRARDVKFGRTSLIDRSFSKNALDAAARLTSRWGPIGWRRRGLFTAESGAKQPIYFVYPGMPLTNADRANLAIAFEAIGEASQRTRNMQAEFLLAFVPTKYRVYHELCEFSETSVCRRWRTNSLPLAVERECRRRGIAFLNLSDPLKAAARTGQLVYFSDDSHWNAHGNAVAAAAIADWITNSNLRPAASNLSAH